VFWRFVEAGRYEIRQASRTGKPVLYRFQKPADERFPIMLELSCRAPDGIHLAEGAHLTPIPIDEAAASLSAILVDDVYYEFILAGRNEIDGLPMVGEDRLIPLKARAWLDLNERHARGEHVDAKDIIEDRHTAGMPRAHLATLARTCSSTQNRVLEYTAISEEQAVTLTLEATALSEAKPRDVTRHVFGEEGGTIGRVRDNSWV
jgi:hypothetical protein